MAQLHIWSTLLETKAGRDKVFRTVGYSAKLISGLLVRFKIKKLQTLSEAISNLRVMTRLLDGVSMVTESIDYGTGSSEPDVLVRVCNVMQNVLYLLYYPCEHIAWAGSVKLMTVDVNKWYDRSDVFWVFALIFSLVSYIHLLRKLYVQERKLAREAARKTGPAVGSPEYVKMHKAIKDRRKNLVLGFVQEGCDFMNAIHWLPSGYLWAEKFPPYVVGFFGSISSFIGLYKNYRSAAAASASG
ncbi:peroxisomal biogenesis factor 11 gamma [Capsaspora owczarzaki ATCC 30864]|uniref:Peroxisomal biogenesis factor 11 gamma n=1 Tax=Capsaspora owczarzaki (strain ATCC 30864) TaxID=595528 RepID=A0A0D2WU66_CAPO3|nr:peroxisomal biogenesis factor 11 gamma [Capsaspora owczarzaki ATCC 30864]